MRRNNAVLLKKIDALVEKYNLLAAERGIPKIPYPSYGASINTISSGFLVRDLNAISNAVKEIEEIPVVDKMKTAKGVEFTAGTISELPHFAAWKDEEGLWYYILDEENICVYADTEKMKARMDGGTLTLNYEDMPYEVLVDNEGKVRKVNSYTVHGTKPESIITTFGLFSYRDGNDNHDWNGNVIRNLTSLTLQNWTNKNITNMSFMFSGCSKLTTLDLSSFNTEKVSNMAGMFSGCSKLTSLNLSGFNVDKVENMTGMFSGCSKLTSLDLSDFNTVKVKDMQGIFSYCNSLISLNVSGFNTSAVTNMTFMFSGCSKLTSLNLSGFDTKLVTDMGSMFLSCSALTSLDLSGFDTVEVKNMTEMFYNCHALTSLNLSGFDTSAVTNMTRMFHGCSALITLNLSGFDTSAVTNMTRMFHGCSALTRLILGEKFDVPFNYGNEETMTNLFPLGACTISMNETMYDVFRNNDLKPYTFSPNTWNVSGETIQTFTVDIIKIATGVEFTEQTVVTGLPAFDVWKDDLWYYAKIEDDICVYADTVNIITKMHNGTLTLKYADMPYEVLVDTEGNEWKVNKYTVGVSIVNEKNESKTLYAGLFGNRDGGYDNTWVDEVIEKLTSLTLENWTNRNVTDMTCMFYGCSALKTLNLSSFNTSAVTDMSSMFYGCSELTTLTLGASFNTSAVTSMAGMFRECSKLTTLNLRATFNTNKVENMANMFYGCSSLTELNVSNFNTELATSMAGMFRECSGLTTLTLGENFNTEAVMDMAYMFAGCSGLITLTLGENFKTSKAMEMSYMFYGCSGLTELNVSEFDTKLVTNMTYMFFECSKLTELNVSNFNTELVTNMAYMFYDCFALKTLTLGASFIVPSNYGGENTITELAPKNACTITMNKNVYDAFDKYDLADYEFSPDSWTGPTDVVQEIKVTPPPTSS